MAIDTDRARTMSDEMFELTAAERVEEGRARRAFRLAAIELRRLADEYDYLCQQMDRAL